MIPPGGRSIYPTIGALRWSAPPANPSGTAGGFFPMGRGWYRKTIAAPEEWRGKKVIVEFEGVYMNAEVWLNDNFIGRHPYGYTTFTCDLTPYLMIGQPNVLRVLVDNASQVNSRWYSGSGIYRHVWLMVAEPVHIGHWGVTITTPEVSAQAAQVHVTTRVENESARPSKSPSCPASCLPTAKSPKQPNHPW